VPLASSDDEANLNVADNHGDGAPAPLLYRVAHSGPELVAGPVHVFEMTTKSDSHLDYRHIRADGKAAAGSQVPRYASSPAPKILDAMRQQQALEKRQLEAAILAMHRQDTLPENAQPEDLMDEATAFLNALGMVPPPAPAPSSPSHGVLALPSSLSWKPIEAPPCKPPALPTPTRVTRLSVPPPSSTSSLSDTPSSPTPRARVCSTLPGQDRVEQPSSPERVLPIASDSGDELPSVNFSVSSAVVSPTPPMRVLRARQARTQRQAAPARAAPAPARVGVATRSTTQRVSNGPPQAKSSRQVRARTRPGHA
jgi:hypothetical protein